MLLLRKKIYLTELVLQVQFKRATINNSGGNLTQHASHRNFSNLLTKVGGAAQQKFGTFPHIGGVRSNEISLYSIPSAEIFAKKGNMEQHG